MTPDVREALRQRFCQPLDPDATRRVVFWHDADGSFEDLFEEMSASGLDTPRPVAFVRAQDGELFSLKRRIYRQEPDQDFLVYTRRERDLSARGLEDDWLADLELVADHFQADLASMLAQELGAADAAVDGIRQHEAFFRAADRRRRFHELVPHADNEAQVTLGVIGAVLEVPDLTTESIVRTWLCRQASGEDVLGELRRYGVEETFASFVSKRTGYAGDLGATTDVAAHLLVTALSAQMPPAALVGLEARMSPEHAQACLNVVHAWMTDEQGVGVLYDLARKVEDCCNLPGRFAKLPAQDLAEADVFPCINECLLEDLFRGMAEGADRADEALDTIRRRKGLHWYGRLRERFDALEAAARLQRFYAAHAAEGFHQTRALDAWKAYTSDWYQADASYRAFCQALYECQRSVADVPAELDDALEKLADWVERIYVNWFLAQSNACWARCAADGWAQRGYVPDVPRQEHFFEERVRSGQGQARKVLVIVSDALRYEVAEELSHRLERDTRGSARITSMQARFPSITEFGMAALLPHRSMSLRDGAVLLDDGMPCATTVQRQTVLRQAAPSAVCVQSKDLMGAGRDARRQMVGDASIVYVYHNQIDAVGEDYSTEAQVFGACEDAIDDLVALVKIATNYLQLSRVLITADHGFLYTRVPLEERERASRSDADAKVVLQGRRYLVCEGDVGTEGPFLRVALDDLGGGSYVGLAPRECVRIRKAGPGDNYVHGGVSLQELCVPVVEFHDRRSGQKGYEERERANVTLLSKERLISGMRFYVDLLQEKPVGDKVLPAEYELVMRDESGNEVSDVCRVTADIASAEPKNRTLRLGMDLKAGVAYDAHVPYYLTCRTKDGGEVVWKEEFHIDISFVPMDDFGF